MGKKKLQGADGINFQMQLTIKGLETVTFPKETLTNESGKDIAWIECLGGKVSAYVNLPHAVRPNNIQPFQLFDCIQIDLISDKVIEYMKAYLKKHMKGNYSNEILKDRFNACKYIIDKAYGANTAFLLDGTEDTAPTVIRIVP